jgi:hypothetical protein
MTGLEGTLANARARVASLRFWADHVVTNYDVYAADHAACPGFTSVRTDLVAARDDVRSFATTVEGRLDASGWVSEAGDSTRPWNRAASHVSDATAAVDEASLRAFGSWKKGASAQYRAAVPPQRSAMATVQEACLDLATACTSVETAGTTHFESVEALAATLVGALDYHFATTSLLWPGTLSGSGTPTFPTYPTTPTLPTYGPESPVQQHQPTGLPCPAGTQHVAVAEIQRRFVTPLGTARTALTGADDALRTAVRDAFSDPAPRRPGPQDESGVVYISQRFDPWPVAGQVPTG